MGKIRANPPVKLIFGFIFKEDSAYEKARAVLRRRFGDADLVSPVLDFVYTGYYEKEFGAGLKRVFVSFKRLIRPEDLPRIKVLTNRIEDKLTRNSLRRVNIDPGYIDLAKLVLASTKDYNHRIYLGRGIYAEITLTYQGKTFRSWPWTYPDYRSSEYAGILNQIRQIYAGQIEKKLRR